jgi:hypothetical protein
VNAAVAQVEGDVVKLIPAPTDELWPRTLGAGGDRVYAVFTRAEGDPRQSIHSLEKGKWKKLATPALDHVRTVTVFGDGLVVIENNLEQSHVLGLDGKKRSEFKTYRSTMKIVPGEARFVTLTDSVAELRDASGKEVGKLDQDTVAKITGGLPDFQCGAHAGGDVFLFHVSDRHERKKKGALVRWDPKKKPAIDDRGEALPVARPRELQIDRAGKVWLNCTSWDGKTLVLVLDGAGKLTTIKK